VSVYSIYGPTGDQIEPSNRNHKLDRPQYLLVTLRTAVAEDYIYSLVVMLTNEMMQFNTAA
jgi:hypothetical protein